MTSAKVTKIELNYSLYGEVVFDVNEDGEATQRDPEVNEFGSYHHAEVTFDNGFTVAGDWYGDGLVDSYVRHPDLPLGSYLKLSETDPMHVAASDALQKYGEDGFAMQKFPFAIPKEVNA